MWRLENGREEILILRCTSHNENLNPNDYDYVKPANGLIKLREKELACVVKLVMKNRLHQESHTRACREIQELRRFCCEGKDRARQFRIDEMSLQQQRGPNTVSHLLTQNHDVQDKVNSLQDARVFHDPRTVSSSGTSHVPSQPLAISSSRRKPSRDS